MTNIVNTFFEIFVEEIEEQIGDYVLDKNTFEFVLDQCLKIAAKELAQKAYFKYMELSG